ncbi:Uncharacterised protein [Vibrio cholerae]|nr:Uncharacterised protein [Vibrio cholerae]
MRFITHVKAVKTQCDIPTRLISIGWALSISRWWQRGDKQSE